MEKGDAGKKTYLRLPWPSFPSSPSPQEYTSPSADRARQCLPPELTASFLMNTCWMDSSWVGWDTDSVPPTPSLPPAPYPVANTCWKKNQTYQQPSSDESAKHCIQGHNSLCSIFGPLHQLSVDKLKRRWIFLFNFHIKCQSKQFEGVKKNTNKELK